MPATINSSPAPLLERSHKFTQYVHCIPGQTSNKIRLYSFSLADAYKNKYNIQNFDCLFKIYLFSAYDDDDDDESEKIPGAFKVHIFFLFFFPPGGFLLPFAFDIYSYIHKNENDWSTTVRFQVLLYKKKNNVISKIFILMALLHT